MWLISNDYFHINGIGQYKIIKRINKTVWTLSINHK